MASKLILVIGATGAQGLATIEALLKPSADGTPSPYKIRALTRDTKSARAQQLEGLGCELVEGNAKDINVIRTALTGIYGAFVNTDGFTIGEKEETFLGIRIFELAKELKVKHYVWGSLDYMLKKGGFKPQYKCGHYDGKGRVTDFLKAQSSGNGEMVWSVLSSGPYMEMLYGGLFVPQTRQDGTLVFAHPLGDGKVPLVALADLGYFARYIFDNPEVNSGVDLEVASDLVAWNELVKTVQHVTGKKAEYLPVTLDQYFARVPMKDAPAASDVPEGATFQQNFTGFWNSFKDSTIKRDLEALRLIHPGLLNLEAWMRSVNYDGTPRNLLKNVEDRGHATQKASK